MLCKKCNADIPDSCKFCPECGWKQAKSLPQKKAKSRGNGQGTVYLLPNRTWRAVVTLDYIRDNDGKRRRIERTKSGFKTKKEALEYLPQLRSVPKKIDGR